MKQLERTEVLSSEEKIIIEWNPIVKDVVYKEPPCDRMLLFKVFDNIKNRYYVTAGYRFNKKGFSKIGKNHIPEYYFYGLSRNEKGFIKTIFNSLYSKDEDNDRYIIKAWAEMPEENWFGIEV